MNTQLSDRLASYRQDNKITSKGKLAVVLFVTRKARDEGLPLDSSAMVAESNGQVLGLGVSAVQTILRDYGIDKVLAAEGGRTSRGSIKNMQEYVAFLNQLRVDGFSDMPAIESWWIERVKDFFTAKPFILRHDSGLSMRSVVHDLLEQAMKRQKENIGTMYAGAVLQHLVGAKLAIVLGDDAVAHNGFSVADAVSSRSGDFVLDNTIIHVTTAPGEALMVKCSDNIKAGMHPFIVTIYEKMPAAFALAENKGISGRVEIIDAEQFIATNVHEWSKFDFSQQKETIRAFIDKYNAIIDEYETDPSLKVDI